MKTYEYSGDVNLEYGGIFIDLSTWDDGYCDAVTVTDLGSACGFDGGVLIEHVTINSTDDSKRIKNALKSCGFFYNIGEKADNPQRFKQYLRHRIAEALCSYGYRDPDDGWDGYRSHHTEIVQTEQDGPMKFDGWKADKRITNTTLEKYVKSVHLRS
jgi:hypothetical protein